METNLLNKKSKNEFYNSKEWRETRAEMLQKQPYCIGCLYFGKQIPSTTVHHIIKFYDQDDDIKNVLLTDKENLVCLCQACHNDIHRKKKYTHPLMQQYLYDVKNYLCSKYIGQGIIIKWTNDKNK